MVEQVLSNALKYTPAGGTIRIYGDGATVVIADNGIGIREEDQARVFEKGFTGYNGRADKKSTGIGLYLCRLVCDWLNHGISLVSRPGQGTLVTKNPIREVIRDDLPYDFPAAVSTSSRTASKRKSPWSMSGSIPDCSREIFREKQKRGFVRKRFVFMGDFRLLIWRG